MIKIQQTIYILPFNLINNKFLMYKHIFIFISLFILCLSDYLPMEKDSKFGDDVCGYYDKNGDYYVKPCDSGKYCVTPSTSLSSSTLSVCQDVPVIETGLSTLDGECSSDFDCVYDLECKGKKCKLSSDCPANQYPYGWNDIGNFGCSEKAPEGYCQYTEYQNNIPKISFSTPPSKLHYCGIYIFNPQGNNLYSLKDIKYAYIGSVDSGEYVSDKILCKSGFSLYYYPDGYLKDPYTGSGSSNSMYQRCVTPTAIDKNDKFSDSCVIYYKEKDEDTEIKKYNVDQLQDYFPSTSTTTPSGSVIPSFTNVKNDLCEYNDPIFKIKMQKFKEYTDKITDEQREKCGDLTTNSNLRYTCDNTDLIKSWYFYEKPSDYILYNGREKLLVVLNHLIQKEFPLYQFSQILNINYLFIILFLLCF